MRLFALFTLFAYCGAEASERSGNTKPAQGLSRPPSSSRLFNKSVGRVTSINDQIQPTTQEDEADPLANTPSNNKPGESAGHEPCFSESAEPNEAEALDDLDANKNEPAERNVETNTGPIQNGDDADHSTETANKEELIGVNDDSGREAEDTARDAKEAQDHTQTNGEPCATSPGHQIEQDASEGAMLQGESDGTVLADQTTGPTNTKEGFDYKAEETTQEDEADPLANTLANNKPGESAGHEPGFSASAEPNEAEELDDLDANKNEPAERDVETNTGAMDNQGEATRSASAGNKDELTTANNKPPAEKEGANRDAKEAQGNAQPKAPTRGPKNRISFSLGFQGFFFGQSYLLLENNGYQESRAFLSPATVQLSASVGYTRILSPKYTFSVYLSTRGRGTDSAFYFGRIGGRKEILTTSFLAFSMGINLLRKGPFFISASLSASFSFVYIQPPSTIALFDAGYGAGFRLIFGWRLGKHILSLAPSITITPEALISGPAIDFGVMIYAGLIFSHDIKITNNVSLIYSVAFSTIYLKAFGGLSSDPNKALIEQEFLSSYFAGNIGMSFSF